MAEQKQAKSKYLRLLQTVVVSGGALAINTLITLLLVPMITNTLGNDAYGFVTLGKNMTQYATILKNISKKTTSSIPPTPPIFLMGHSFNHLPCRIRQSPTSRYCRVTA